MRISHSPAFSYFFFFLFPPLWQIAMSSCSVFFPLRCSCSPMFVTLGHSTLPLYFETGRAVCQEEQTDWLLWTAALCPARPTRTRLGTVCKTTLACLFMAEAPLGGGRGWGRQDSWQGGKEKGFTTLKRVGIPPEPFPHLAGSCENNCLAYTLSLSLCADGVPAMSQLWEQQVVEKSGGLVICIANISKANNAYLLVFVKFWNICIVAYIYFCLQRCYYYGISI